MSSALVDFTLLVAVVLISAFGVPALARAGLQSCDMPAETIPARRLMLAAIVGSALPGATGWLVGGSVLAISLVAGLGAVLLVAAYVDRETGWAPDHLLAPFAFAGFTLAGLAGSWGLQLWQGVIAGLLVYPLVMAAWIGLRALTPTARVLPPNDLLSLLVPCVMLGPDLAMGYLVCVAAVLILVRLSPSVHKIFLREDVAKEMVSEMELDAEAAQSFVTLLIVSLPVSFAFLIVRIFMEGVQ